MNKFSNIVNANRKRNIYVKVGDTEIFIGRNSRGLAEMIPEAVKWLDEHKMIRCWYSAKELELVYRKSAKFEQIMWG